jgi:choline-sulfatase
VSGAYGSRLARTPNLDRFASEGIRFDRAYCSCPLSTPSRMAFLTGRYPRSIGVTLSRTPLPAGEVTIGGWLRSAGYEALAIGKTHYYDPLVQEFDHCIDLREHRVFLAAREPGPSPPDVEVLGPWQPFLDPASIWLNSGCLPYACDAEMPDTFFSEMARQFLVERRPKPFFLWVGFYVTHSPFRFPIEFHNVFDQELFPIPELGPEDDVQIPPVFRGLNDREKRGIIAAYYTSVAYMDRNIGLILDALDQARLADQTLVIFSSDHGYLLGEHGRFEKHCCYEEAVRAALVMRLPGVIEPARATDALVELIDVMPTVLELCGLEPAPDIHGRSLAPLLRGDTPTHRQHVISEYADNAEAMIQTERWKLIYSAGNRRRRDGYAIERSQPGPTTRLYDLAADPHELRTVADLPENRETVEHLLELLAAHMKATARDASAVPETNDPHAILAHCLPPGELRSASSR